MTILTASFDGPVTLPTYSRSYENICTREDDRGIGLPNDGIPRISTEGAEILIEGLHGDFSRWCWGIGNHPLEIPVRHVRNLHIRAMKDEPHFIASFYCGHDYPITIKNQVLTPNFCFDQVDTMRIEPGRFEASETDPYNHIAWGDSIHLRQSADFWAYAPIMLDDNGILRTRGVIEETDEEDEGMEECPVRIEHAPRATASLDAWMEGTE